MPAPAKPTPFSAVSAMNARDAIKISIDSGAMITSMYVDDLTDAELLKRPCPGCNHINWQIGHLIVSENEMLGMADPAAVKALPAGFKEKYGRETAGSDDPGQFCTKAELMSVYQEQRAATMAALEKATDEHLAKETGVEWATTNAALYSMQGSHWLMHAGQWAVVRRMLGRKPLF
jgi:hypothetical protein